MENENESVGLEKSDFIELKREIKQAKARIGWISLLLALIVIGLAYLSFDVYRENNASESMDSSNRVLLVHILSEDSEFSDVTQVKNALSNGGMIQLELSVESLEKALGSEQYGVYGASNSDGYHYILGALLNYIASRGWSLIQAPTSGLANQYYFTR